MKLNEYLKSNSRKERRNKIKKLASELSVSVSSVSHWAAGIRNPRPTVALKIEKITLGRVGRSDLRPDVYPTE